MDVHCLHDAGEDQQELQVLVGGVAGVQQVLAGVGADGPVVVLAGAVDAGIGLFVEEADQAVTGGHPLHGLHGQLVLVHGQVAHGEDGGHLMLGGGHLVVLGGGGDAQLPQLLIQVGHEGAHPVPDDAEVLVLQLLPLGGGCAEEGAPGVDEVPALQILLPVHQEVLLLGPHLGDDLFGRGVPKQPEDAQRLGADGLHGAQQGGFLVQRLAVVGDEDGGDAQDGAGGHLLDEGGGGHVPGGVAPGVVGGAQPAGGEGGGVGLPHDQLLAGELKQGAAVFRAGEEGVVLLRGDAGERLEPVGIVGGALFHRPVLHGVGHDVGGLDADVAAVFHHVHDLAEHALGEPLPHHIGAEYIGTEDLCDIDAHRFNPFHTVWSDRPARGEEERAAAAGRRLVRRRAAGVHIEIDITFKLLPGRGKCKPLM